jgi:hypothetical protein
MTSRAPAQWHARHSDNESPPHERMEAIASRNRARPPATAFAAGTASSPVALRRLDRAARRHESSGCHACDHAEPALLSCRDAPPGHVVAVPAWRGAAGKIAARLLPTTLSHPRRTRSWRRAGASRRAGRHPRSCSRRTWEAGSASSPPLSG